MTDIVADTPLEELAKMLPSLTADQRVAAKARLRANKTVRMEALADEWREKQMPQNMKRPVTVRIKHWGDQPIRGTWQLFGEPIHGYRPVHSSEVVCVDLTDPIVRDSMRKGIIELTDNEATRPLVFPDTFTAECLDPTPRRHRRYPPAHIEAAIAKVRPITAEIRRQYAIAQEGGLNDEDAERLPAEVRTQLRNRELERELKAEAGEANSTLEVTRYSDGDPVKNNDGVVRRRRKVVSED